jgi:hypothetical protein
MQSFVYTHMRIVVFAVFVGQYHSLVPLCDQREANSVSAISTSCASGLFIAYFALAHQLDDKDREYDIPVDYTYFSNN